MARRQQRGRKQEMGARRRTGRKPTQPSRQEPRRRRSAGLAEDAVLGLLLASPEPVRIEDIVEGLGLASAQRKILRPLLDSLCRQGKVVCQENRYSAGTVRDVFEATLAVHPRGFGFAAVIGTPPREAGGKDIFIPPGSLGNALHGDRVLVRMTDHDRGRAEGVVVRVLSRQLRRLVGLFVAGKKGGMVVPEDERYPFHIIIPAPETLNATGGKVVVAEIVTFVEGGNPEGRVVEVLGDPNDLKVQTEIVIRKFELPHVFDEAVQAQVAAFDGAVRVGEGRLDLRDIPHVTIDGEDARDFDDAVAIARNGTGYRLYVSIADVSHYVIPGSPVDEEAYRRGTSVYFPTMVVPMLPERLSNDLCSLVPHQDRYTFSAIMEFDAEGRRTDATFSRSVIQSRHRLTYTKVKAMLVDQDQALRHEYRDVVDDLAVMGELAARLEARRMARGSIGFEIPEAKVLVGENNTVSGIVRLERNMAHKLIEEFMLAANEAVAETISQKALDGIYRIHEEPDPIKVAEFSEFATSMGLILPPNGGSPHWFGQVLALVGGTPKEYIISNLLLRAMKQARYSAKNVGHFGLAARFYTHFTSPIRRYPDLMVHRTLAAFLAGQSAGRGRPGTATEEAGDFLSKRERTAVDAEREVVERLSVHYMADKVGEEFDAVVSGVSSYGLFIDLLDVFVTGAVSLADLGSDGYEVDEKRHRLFGQYSGLAIQMGDLVRVKLLAADRQRRRLNFGLVAVHTEQRA
ncbi:MAG TPA: ribonuclease R [Desulfurivibrionaceae bacterium]|nr:ribonuclease R [Desulfurivibrionaceae bacterium]